MQVQAVTAYWDGGPSIPIRRAAEQNRIVLTGAAGDIGRATAVRLARQGFALILSGRTETPALATTVEACRACGVDVETILADLSLAEERQRFATVLRQRDDVAALIHVASPAVAAPLDVHVKVNFEALVDLTQALLPGFLKRQSGRVIAVGSSAVEVSIRGWEAYAGAKAMVGQFLHTFDRKYRPYGISGQVVAPTRVDTAMSQSLGPVSTPTLIPEEVAACINEVVTVPAGDATYISLSPFGTKSAYYGVFYDAKTSTADAAAPAGRSREISGSDPNGSADLARLERTVRMALELPSSVPLENGGLGLTPGWDSLKHIELILAIEREYAIAFSSSEIDRLATYDGLRKIVDAKSRLE
jgi:3-oxoacyl-[acyl-carrier protein] reductase